MYAKKLTLENDDKPIKLIHEKTRGISLNKYLADAEVASRRGAEAIIQAQRVKIDGLVAKLGDRVYDHQTVSLDDQPVKPIQQKVYYILNKPKGIVCTTELVEDNIIEYMNVNEKIFPVGRLDKDSTGLIILTNDGDIVNKILRNEFGHEKEYVVTVDKPLEPSFLNYMKEGVVIYNQKKNTYQQTLPCEIKALDEYRFSITLKEGMNRQIRRMTQALGYHVEALERIRVMNFNLDGLPIGYYRDLTNDELIYLKEHLVNVK
ncbi:MAG: pseudouridine synthase [Acholeplasma sp.]|nr:pseudouridine synthase [Acholeplasma sp.]